MMRKNRRTFYLLAILGLIFCASLGSLRAEESEESELLTALDARAAEIVGKISPEACALLPPISDRAAWERYAKIAGGEKIIQTAEKLLETPIVECPEELYKEYFKNGNRNNAQRAIGQRSARLQTLALAELIEHQGRFLPALEETIRDFCAYPSWVLPAHDPSGQVFDGKLQSADLVGTHRGAMIAVLRQAMLEVLSPEVAALMAENVEKRVLAPYEAAVRGAENPGMWWIRTTNNWNTVCHNGTLVAALALCDDAARRAWFLAATERFVSEDFFKGFTPDGYCSEGIGYWNYGYGNFVELAEIAYRVTGGTQGDARGEVNLFACPKNINVTLFAPRMEIKPGFYPSFADCALTAKPDEKLLGLMSRRLGLGLTEFESEVIGRDIASQDTSSGMAVYTFQPEKIDAAIPPTSDNATDGPRTDFADAGILICRPAKDADGNFDAAQLAAVFKGGHNNELHNHNDIGSFGLIYGKNWLVIDPGGETYTRRTFSAHRYEGELLNSFGHPVPKIAGTLQAPGDKSKGVVTEKSFSDECDIFELDMTSAYPVEGLKSVLRRFEFFRAPAGTPNRVVVTDTVTFAAGKENLFESALITFADGEIEAQSDDASEITLRLQKDADAVTATVRAQNAEGKPLALKLEKAIVGENDEQAKSKPNRLALALTEPTAAASIRIEFTAAK